jgi:hypothetical protein
MSRTYRKRKANSHFDKDLNPWEFERSTFRVVRRVLDKNSDEYKVLNAKYHKDGVGDGVPHRYTNLNFERSYRRIAKEQINKWKKNSSHEEVIPKFRRSIGWQYY